MDNAEILDRYEKYMIKKEMSKNTIDNYLYELNVFSSSIDKSFIEVNTDDIKEYLKYWEQQGNSSGRLRFKKSTISSFYTFLIKRKMIIDNPFDNLDYKIKDKITRDKNVIAWDDLKKLIKLDYKDSQSKVMIHLLITVLGNIKHIRGLEWSNIDLKNNKINIKEGEYKKVILINQHMSDMLKDLRKERYDNKIRNKYVFISRYNKKWNNINKTTMSNQIRKIGKEIGIEDLRLIDFKYTMVNILSDEFSSDEIGIFLYDNYIKNEEKMLEIYEKIDKKILKRLFWRLQNNK